MKKKLSFISVFLLLLSCKKLSFEGAIESLFEDFETYSFGDSAAVLEGDQWTSFTYTNNQNALRVDTTVVHQGNNSMRFDAVASNGDVSKCDLHTVNLLLQEKDIFHFSGWYFIEGNTENLFIADFETNAEISSSPGTRIAINTDGYLWVERSKMLELDIYQTSGQEVVFPTNQWVHLEVEFKLSIKKKGYIKLWQDGMLLIDQSNIRTNPKDVLFITLGTARVLNSLEVGITAAGSAGSTTMWVDDIQVEKL